MSKWLSRKFLMAIGNALFIILNEGFRWGIPQDVYWYLFGIVASYILGEAMVDIKKA